MRLTKMMLDPRDALRLSASAKPSHPIRADKVRAYARCMREGRWIFNAIPLIVSRQGVLLDGHHRLRAGIEAGISFPTLVASDVPEDVVHIIDRPRTGTFASVLQARGVSNARSVERLLHQLLSYEDGLLGRRAGRQPWSRMERVLTQNPTILEAVASPHIKGLSEIPEAVRHLLLFMGRRANPQAFARMLASLAEPNAWPADEPGVLLRAAFRAQGTAGQKDIQTGRLAALGIIALNATQADRRLLRLGWSYGQAFPKLAGYAPLAGNGRVDDETRQPASPSGDSSVALDRAELVIETISPTIAARYLQRNHGNRQLITAHVNALARDMRLGRWMLSPQPICFAEGGDLLNGQHRLNAVILADVSIEIPVVRNLPDTASNTYDLHAARSPVAANLPAGFGDKALVNAMANLLWRREIAPDSLPRAKASAEELREILAAHPRLIELRTLARRAVELGRASVLGYSAYVIERENADLSQPFLDGLFGVGPAPVGSSVATLRRRLLRMRLNRASQEEQLSAILETWSLVRARGRL